MATSKKKTKKKVVKKVYDLVKVVDPHSHMPKNVKDAFFDVYRGDCGLSNDSHVNWTVGGEFDDFDDEEVEICNKHRKTVDDWLLANGFVNGEDIMILYWW